MFRIRTLDQYHQASNQATNAPEEFWGQIAQNFTWHMPWNTVLEADMINGHNRWFTGGVLNITENCLDRHLQERGNQPAIIWELNNPEQASVTLTYSQLHEAVCQFAGYLKRKGVKKGDRVCLYMPMVPDLAIAVLACARIGAIHSVVFAGFSAQALADRINDAEAICLISGTHINRGAKQIDIAPIVTEALARTSNIKIHITCPITEELPRANCEPEPLEAEDPLFILYTSGSTGKPKGVVHTCGGYMVYAGYTFANVFQYDPGDVFWCTADVGWVTGHTYLLYGPLLNGATTLMFEGVPTYPDAGRFWDVIERHSVNIFYTAPTAIRSLMGAGNEFVEDKKLSSLKSLGTVGEPINEEAWQWYHQKVGKGRCPIVDTWWQTETGGIMISALAGITSSLPAHAGLPLPGVSPVLLTPEGEEIESNNVEGLLAIKRPWPGMIRTTWGDHERCRQTYFAPYPGYYFTGDGARRTSKGLYRIIGRVDDVINISGHRFGTAEIENAINQTPGVVESAVVGYPHAIKGQGIFAYVIAEPGLEDAIKAKVEAEIGKIARPDRILIVEGLPKTRSGKIMRRILRKIAEGDTSSLGDTTTLLDPEIVDKLIKQAQKSN